MRLPVETTPSILRRSLPVDGGPALAVADRWQIALQAVETPPR